MKKIIFYSIVVLFFVGCKSKNNTTSPQRKDIIQAVYASGKIYPLNNYKVYTKLSGYVQKLHVHVGDIIKIGDPLVTIKSEVSELNVNAAKNLLDLARKNANENASFITALKQDVASSKSKYELDSINFKRFESLSKENATSKIQYDQSKTQFEISKQNYLKALNSLNNTRDKIKVELENAQIQYDAQLSNRNDYTLTSAVNGKVYDIVPKEGELVNTQIVLMEIGDGEKFEVELSVDETDVSLIKNGQSIVYAIDAYKDVTFNGKVEETYPRISQGNKTAKIISSIMLDNKYQIFSGMTVEANIIISEKKNALVIPREFIIEGNKVKIKSTEELTTIQKGVEDLEFIEILSGIDEHVEISLP